MKASLLEGLNPEQEEAVRTSAGPLLILAGAGSGKTRVITTKIAWLIREEGLSPSSILAVTFTNKAAGEMRERAKRLEEEAESVMIRTFHSFGCWFLRRNASLCALDSNFTIYDEDDSLALLSSAVPDRTRSSLSPLVSAIARAKDHMVQPDDPAAHAFSSDPEFPELYAKYQERLRRTGNVDFADLIGLPLALLRSQPAVRERTRQRFPCVLVDEYQDSNAAQFELLKELYAPDTHLCVVGDDDQSIYRFRGADVRNILTFPDSFPGTKIVRLERNYRSRSPILEAAHAIVSHNEGRLGKELKATRPGGRKPFIVSLDSQEAEAEWCAKRAEKHVRGGGRWSDVAFLYRTNAQSLVFETVLTRMSIPYRVVGSLKFYEREEIKDALSWLCFLANPRDSVSFGRILNKPARGIGESSKDKILELLAGSLSDCVQATRAAVPSLSRKAASGAESFLGLFSSFSESIDSGSTPLYDLVQRVITESGLVEHHKGQDEIAGTQKAANLEELANAASLYPPGREGLSAFLDAIALDRSRASADESADALTLITMHNTKGLEFPVVVVTGLEQGLFPRSDDSQEDIEEQRRLFYVAITRAMDEVDFTWSRSRRIRGRMELMQPSMFLYELPDELRAGLAERPQAADSGGWRPGQGVYHEDYGSGAVMQVKPGSEGLTLLIVQFESGLTMRFVPRYDRKLEKIGS